MQPLRRGRLAHVTSRLVGANDEKVAFIATDLTGRPTQPSATNNPQLDFARSLQLRYTTEQSS